VYNGFRFGALNDGLSNLNSFTFDSNNCQDAITVVYLQNVCAIIVMLNGLPGGVSKVN